MQENLEHDQQASSEIRKKELRRQRQWKLLKGAITLAKLFIKFCVCFFGDNSLDE